MKGTRMPDYSIVAKERDIYGELGWIPNFNVKRSKDNDLKHKNYKEFFDAPKEYETEFQTATMTQTDFYRANAPKESIARDSFS